MVESGNEPAPARVGKDVNAATGREVQETALFCAQQLVRGQNTDKASRLIEGLRTWVGADAARVVALSDGGARLVCDWRGVLDDPEKDAAWTPVREAIAALVAANNGVCEVYRGDGALAVDFDLVPEQPPETEPQGEESELQKALENEIESRMREALESDEFVIHLQPKLDLRKDEIVGAEALVRWFDPRVGLRLPGAFVPLFEKNGFIVDLDLFVFEQVCALLHAWSVAGVRPVTLSVNLSRTNLLDPEFPRAFDEIRSMYGVSPFYIEFELSETLAFENPIAFIDLIDRIHRAGYGCSIDHFGGGHSSVNMLKDLEVDVLKLDRAFFGGPYVETGREADVVATVIGLARRLHMKTVAEGVETEEQKAFLQDVGCDMIQGYLVSKPISVAEFEKMVFGTEIATAPLEEE